MVERRGPVVADARAVVVLLHGRGRDPADVLQLADRIALDDVAYLAPAAPGRTWYPQSFLAPLEDNEPWLSRALASVDELVRAVEDPRRVVLAGFSQGACLIADHVAAAGPRRFAGAAVLTGALIGTPDERATPSVAHGLPMAFASSRHDEWVSLADARATADAFGAAGADVRWLELDDRVHHVSDRAVDALRELLTAIAPR